MKSLSDLILEAEDQQNNKNKPVKSDAGTFKKWPAFETTVRAWLKVMSGQEEVKDSFFDDGFLVPTTIAACLTNTQAKVATLTKQLDSTCKVLITEYTSDYSFLLDDLKPYGYQSTGWSSKNGIPIADVIKLMKSEAKSGNSEENKNNDNKDNGNNDNGSSGGTM